MLKFCEEKAEALTSPERSRSSDHSGSNSGFWHWKVGSDRCGFDNDRRYLNFQRPPLLYRMVLSHEI